MSSDGRRYCIISAHLCIRPRTMKPIFIRSQTSLWWIRWQITLNIRDRPGPAKSGMTPTMKSGTTRLPTTKAKTEATGRKTRTYLRNRTSVGNSVLQTTRDGFSSGYSDPRKKDPRDFSKIFGISKIQDPVWFLGTGRVTGPPLTQREMF